MWYREYRVGKHSGRQLVVEIGYREGDRKIFYRGGLLAAGVITITNPPSAKNLVKRLPYILPNFDECEVSPNYGFDLAIVSNEVLNVDSGFDPIRNKYIKVITKRL